MQSTVMMEELIEKRVAHFLKMDREAALVELSDGRIYYNSRVHWPERQIIVVDEKLGAMTVEKLGKIGRL